MKLHKIEDLHEDSGEVILMNILSLYEPPYCRNGHCCDLDFVQEEWTHFIELEWNNLLDQAKEGL